MKEYDSVKGISMRMRIILGLLDDVSSTVHTFILLDLEWHFLIGRVADASI